MPVIFDYDPYSNCFKSIGHLGYSNPNTQPACQFTFTDLCGSTSIADFSKNELVNFKVYPHPFFEETTIEIVGLRELKSPILSIYNFQDQLVEKLVDINEEKLIFFRKNLNARVYVFELSDGKTTFAPQIIIGNGER